MASEEFMDEIIESEIEQLKAEKESYYHDYRMKFDVETKKLHTEIVALKSELHELKTKYDFQQLVKENKMLKAQCAKMENLLTSLENDQHDRVSGGVKDSITHLLANLEHSEIEEVENGK